MDGKRRRLVIALVQSGSVSEAARLTGVDRSTVYRRLKESEFQFAYQQLSDEMELRLTEGVFGLVDPALQDLGRLIGCAVPTVSFKASSWVLDHALALASVRASLPTQGALMLEEQIERAAKAAFEAHGDE